MREDFLAFKEYYRQATSIVPPRSFYRRAMDHKFTHSIEVLHIGEKLLKQTPELSSTPEATKDLAKKALLFHDVGRFEEYVCQYNREKEKQIITKAASNKYDHGLLGYKLLKKIKTTMINAYSSR